MSSFLLKMLKLWSTPDGAKTTTLLPRVTNRAKEAMEDYVPNVPPIVIITTKTFEYLLDNLLEFHKSRFHVFIDEGLPPIRQVTFSPGNKDDYLSHLDVDDQRLATPKDGSREKLEWAAFSPNKLSGQQLDHLALPQFRQLAELVVSDHYDAFVWETEKSIEALGVLSPQAMSPFKSVTLIVAIFERTLLPLLWEQKYEISFVDYPLNADLFDAHTTKGPLISIWHVFADGDLPSKRNFNRSLETLESNESDIRKKVIYEVAKQLDAKFSDGAYCWAANEDFKNPDNVLSGKRMPAISAGLNEFRHNDTVVSLVCINPKPWVKQRMMELFDLEDDHLYELWRFAYTYQTIGRCSLRLRESDRPINIVVTSVQCAEQLAELFPGSVVQGQITDLPRLSQQTLAEHVFDGHRTAFTRADNTAYSKYRTREASKGGVPLPKDKWFESIRRPRMQKG